MRIGRAARIGVFCLATTALFGGAGIIGCTVGSDGNDNIQPTEPSPDVTPPQRGTLSITPNEVTLTIQQGSSPGGIENIFRVTGGTAPFYWSNSSIDMAYLVPIDEYGQGYHSAAMYRFHYYPEVSGNDTVLVRDGAGNSVTAKVTLTIETGDAPAPPTPTPLAVLPSAVNIACGGSQIFTASGGTGSYNWSHSSPTASLDSVTGTPVTLTTNNPGDCGSTITVTVISGAEAAAATVTVAAAP